MGTSFIESLLGRGKRTNISSPVSMAVNDNAGMPTSAGRTTEPNTTSMYGLLMGEFQAVTPDFEIELLKLCSYLAKYNGDISYAIDNIVQLGNTPAQISFDSSVPKELIKEMIAYVKGQEKSIYPGGMNSLQNDLFAQVGQTGAVSMESIPKRNLTGVEKAAVVDPYYIRFKYNPATYTHDAYQKTSKISGASVDGGMKLLNPMTYKYYALRTFDGNPYGIPPMIASFEALEIEKDMLQNMRHIVKKLGLFGFLSVYVTAPTRNQGEKQVDFEARSRQYLESIRPTIEKGFNSGTVVGFKGAHEFKMEATNANISGFGELYDQIMQMKAAGIKQDPLMLGRNFNVAETMAKVIMAKLTTQIANIQRLVATVRADIYYMMLIMGGYKLKSVFVEYEAPMIGDKLRDEQAWAAKINNRLLLRDSGVIDQQELANELDYEAPFAKKNVDYTVPSAAEAAKKAGAAGKDTTNPKNTQATEGTTNYSYSGYLDYLGGSLPEFIYEAANCTHSHKIVFGKPGNEDIDGYVDNYQEALEVEYEAAIAEVAAQIGRSLAEFGNGATLEMITDRVLYILYTTWITTFQQTSKPVVDKFVTQIYNHFRKDKAPFSSNFNPPTVHFNLHDIRTLEYFRNSDQLYLGKFITDADVRKKVTEYVKSKYIFGNEPIGNNTVAIQEFRDQFVELMHFENWKIRRIIDTTSNTMRNFGAIAYIKDAELVQFRIQGISDQLQCGYCAYMDGMVFDVQKAFDRIDKVVQGFPNFVKSDKPFITNLYGGKAGLDALTELTAEEIQASGIDVPVYHPHCRCMVVAVQ